MHPDFHGIHLGTFVGLSNPYISKATNFIFSQNSPPSNSVLSVLKRKEWRNKLKRMEGTIESKIENRLVTEIVFND